MALPRLFHLLNTTSYLIHLSSRDLKKHAAKGLRQARVKSLLDPSVIVGGQFYDRPLVFIP